jgi:hypothetical protein
MLDDITLISTSYNTPLHIETMLKSFVAVHGDGPFKFVLMENSTETDTTKILDIFKVPYVSFKGDTHSISVDKALVQCKTKYALLVDSDIIFRQHIGKLIEVMRKNDGALMGEITADRGGFKLKKRVNPWFCLIDMGKIREKRIRFHDQFRINTTNSGAFYRNIPININANNYVAYYDVGSTFYEDINKSGLKILEAPGIIKYFTHFEGSSWHRNSGHEGFIKIGEQIYNKFLEARKSFDHVDITGKFFRVQDENILVIMPVFCPNDELFEVNKRSIVSFLNYVKDTCYQNIQIICCGYAAKDKFWQELVNITFPYKEVTMERLDNNFGKAFIVNQCFKKYHSRQKYLLTMDSDILWDSGEYDILRRLVSIPKYTDEITKWPFGMASLNQKGHNCHIEKMLNKEVTMNGECIKWPSSAGGIAGGCLFISTEAFKKVGMYRVMGVYSGDDGFLLHDMIKAGYFACVPYDINIWHESNNDIFNGKYLKWKKSILQKCLSTDGKIISDDELAAEAEHVKKGWETEWR